MMTEPDVTSTCTPLDAALTLARLGLRVLPITPGKKHPPIPGWQDAATTNPDTITSWWTDLYRGHGVGIATGPGSGVWVLDLDVANGKKGRESLEALFAVHGRLPSTVAAITGTGGGHWYFRWDPDRPITNGMATNLPEGLDIRGQGGQVVAPPTIHPAGGTYSWAPGRAPWEIDVADAPDWLYGLLLPPTIEEQPATPVTPPPPPVGGDIAESPADHVRRNYSWHTELERDGWTEMRGTNGDTWWCRPGKNPRDGHSAVLHEPDGPLVIFTSDVPPGLANVGKPTADGSGRSVSLFDYVAAYRHNGDRAALARDIRRSQPTTGLQTLSGGIRSLVIPQPTGEQEEVSEAPEKPARLTPILARDLAKWVADTPAPEWLVSNFLAAGGDDYGLISAEPKVGKTWTVGDLSVAVAAGYPWMGRFETRQGRVLVYIGEGGKRTAERRFQAIADHYQVDFADLPIWLVEGVPHLSVVEDELHLRNAIEDIEPQLVIIDPLYLAARGSDSRQLIEMGAVLETAQRICQEYSAALLFAHHWNKSGTGTGGARSTGAGPWEWARVSLSMRADGDAIKSPPNDSGYICVEQKLIVEVEGGNVIPTTLNLRREIHSVPGSLTAPLGYRLDVVEGYSERAAKEHGDDIRLKVLATIRAHPKRCTIKDLWAADSPFRVGGRDRVAEVVTVMLRAGELVAINYRHPDTQKAADRLDVGATSLGAVQHSTPALNGGDA